MSSTAPVLPAALRACLPVAFGYVPLGVAFGLLLVDSGQPWWLAPLMGAVVYAGSAQFLAIGLLAAHAPLPDIFIATLLLNLRHVFFGFSMLARFPARGWRRLYLIFGLTDETWSLLSAAVPPAGVRRDAYDLAVTALDHAAWVTGCTLGAVAGGALDVDTRGLDFALTALFLVLAVEQWHALHEPWPFLLAAAAGLLALALAPPAQFLLVALAFTLSGLLAVRRLRGWTPAT